MGEFSRAPSCTQGPGAVAGGDLLTSSLFFFFYFPSLIFKECEMSQPVEGGCLGYLGTASEVAQRSLSVTPQTQTLVLPAREQLGAEAARLGWSLSKTWS